MPITLSSKRQLLTFINATVNTLLPHRCMGTGEIVDSLGMLTSEYWTQLQFIEAPYCATCGLPFTFHAPEGSLCGGCLESEPEFDRARSAVIYDEPSKKLVLGFKYGDRPHAVHTFIPWLFRVGRLFLDDCDIIIPVPLHPRRLWQRRYNQSALLAKELAKKAHKPAALNILLRTKHTPPQQGLSRSERNRNVVSAFSVPKALQQHLKGKKVLLIDDVFTTGATLNACARVLKAAGAQSVSVLTIARVTKIDT